MKIIFFTTNGIGLGHLTRTISIANTIKKIIPKVEILFLTSAQFTKLLDDNDYHYIKLPTWFKKIEKKQVRQFTTNKLIEVTHKFRPDAIIYDTYLPSKIIKKINFFEIKNVLVLRKYENKYFQSLIERDKFNEFDLILVVHSLKELKELNIPELIMGHILNNNKFCLTGPIIQDFNFKKKSKDKIKFINQGKFIISCYIGKEINEDILPKSNFLYVIQEASQILFKKIKNLKFNVVLGPYSKKEINSSKYFTQINYQPNFLKLIEISNLFISHDGYNICNELIYTRTPSILKPLFRGTEDQLERALNLEKKGVAKVLTEFNAQKLADMVLDLYNHPEKLKKMKKAFDNIKLDIGNERAARAIIGLLKDKKFKLKVSDKCNNNCIFCDSLDVKERYDKSLSEIKKELDNLKEKNYNHIILPCNSDIRKDFFEILRYAKNLDFKLTLETNGRMFYYKDFCKKASKYIGKFIIYFKDNKKEQDLKTRVKRSYEQVKKGIENLNGLGGVNVFIK